MATTRIRNVKAHEAKRKRVTLPNPHIRESELNQTGVTLTAAEYRKVRAAVDRLNKGGGVEFANAEEAIAHFRARAKALRR